MQKFTLSLLFVSLSACCTISYADNIPPLTYQYTTPYTGAGSLTIYNNGNNPITISTLNFNTNVTLSGNPWGTLWGWKSTVTSTANPDGINTDYSINETPAVTIAPHQSAALTYGFDSQNYGGPFHPYNAAMNPSKVTVSLNGGSPVSVSIQGMCSGTACKDPGNGKRVMGYYPDWAYWREPKFLASDVPFNKINTVAYAFSIFDSNGNISLFDPDSDPVNLPIISQARQQYPYLNASLSFGGWSWASVPSGWLCKPGASPVGPAACFSQMASDPTATATFITKAVKAMQEVRFNGIDIDWEYPHSAIDTTDYINLLQGLRTALNKQGELDHVHYYLTIAAPAGIDKINAFTAQQWQQIATIVDYIDVMTYDFHGGWDQGSVGSDFMSAMSLDPTLDPTTKNPTLSKYNVIDAIKTYLDNGVPANKIVLGIPLYGRMVNIASAGQNQGLYQTITGVPAGEWDNQQSGHTGMIDYKCIVDSTACGNKSQFVLPQLTLVEPTADNLGKYSKTPWGYANNLFITYDDINSSDYKAQWLLQKGLAGVMFWDLTGDFPANNQNSIISSVDNVLNASK
jgi:chitinase